VIRDQFLARAAPGIVARTTNIDPSDSFADLLAPGEAVVAAVAGPGPSRVDGTRTWVQLALSSARVLAVVLRKGPEGGSWQPVSQLAAARSQVRLARFPGSPGAAARLEVTGLPEPLVLRDIDDPAVFPDLEPFLAAWGQDALGAPIGGPGSVHERAREEGPARNTSSRLPMAIAGGVLAVAAMGCACAGLAGLVSGLGGS